MKFSTAAFSIGMVFAAATPALASEEYMLEECARLARDFYGVDANTQTNMRYSDPRVDGTETVGGEIYLESAAPYIACAFKPDQTTIVEFFVDGQDQMFFVTGGGSGGSSSGMPNYEQPYGGVLPAGSDFTASSVIPCSRPGTGAASCDVGVVREGNGNGWVMVFWPDAGNRVLYFENGEIMRYDESEADGGARLSVTRDGDIQYVTVGDAQFEIFDALLIGG